jgi:hypothetical protein
MKKYIKRCLIILILITGISKEIYSQINPWHEKYWFYRYRLRNYFVDIGEGIGKSILCGVRNYQNEESIMPGDQTIDLAWYIGILAVENYLLFEERGTLDDMTLTELYYALIAFERLDVCEHLEPWNDVGIKDGFFMRYDVSIADGDHSHDMNSLNKGLNENDIFANQPPGMPTYVDRYTQYDDYYWSDEPFSLDTERKRTAMSQDQAAALMMGFALVEKFAPSYVSFYNTEENTQMSFDFKDFAKESAWDIAQYIQNAWLDIPGNNLPAIEDETIIDEILGFSSINPFSDCGSWINTDPNDDLVLRGYDARFARQGFIKAAESITGDNFSNSGFGFVEWEALAHFMDVLWNPNHWVPGPYHNRTIWANLAVAGNSWNYGFIRKTPGVLDRLLKKSNAVTHSFWNGPVYFVSEEYPSMETDHEKLYLLLWHALHAQSADEYDDLSEYENRIEEILESAPLCGPYNYSVDNEVDIEYNFEGCDGCYLPNRAPLGWRSGNRFRNEPSEFNGHDYQFPGNYPGHDYMMLYTLFRKYRKWRYGENENNPFRNMIYTKENQSYPYQLNSSSYGTISNPANLRSFATFDFSGKINTTSSENGSLNIVSGENVRLTIGFHAKAGSRFSARIEDYNCFEITNSKFAFKDNNYILSKEKHNRLQYDSSHSKQISMRTEDKGILFFPNPAQDFIHFKNHLDKTLLSYEILNQQGNLVLKGLIRNSSKINISNLKNGFYVIKMYENLGLVYTGKIVIMNNSIN